MTIFDSIKNVDLQLELDVLKKLCIAVNTPRSLCIYILIECGQHVDILNLSTKSEHYTNSVLSIQNFKDDLLVTGFLTKSPNLDLGIDLKKKAIDSFFEGERQCEATSNYLRQLDPFGTELSVIQDISSICNSILGPLSKHALRKIERNFGFGPGATTRIGGNFIGSSKYDESPHLTGNLYPFYKSILGPLWHNNATEPEIVRGNRFTTVPKNAKTDRGICIEPDLNIYVQLGIGTFIKDRLAAKGIDLRDQTKNQYLASKAQELQLATIDLKGASDTISLYLVFLLLNPEWFHLLEICRSPETLIEGKYHINHKFSSMGNGYTFELESLIFTAVCRSVVPEKYWDVVSVYGDDIIVPQQFAKQVIERLNLCGFLVNPEKSFLAGSFFESCGTDYFNHVPVRPIFARGRSEGIPYELQLANSIRLYSNLKDYGCDERFKKCWFFLVKKLPIAYRNCNIPKNLGDIGLINTISCPEKAPNQMEGYIVNTISPKPLKRVSKSFGFLLLALTRIGIPDIQLTRNKLPVRGLLGKPVVNQTLVREIDLDLGWQRIC